MEQDANKQLSSLYEDYLKRLSNLFDLHERHDYSLPLFMEVFPEYRNVAMKLMIIGKETNGWYSTLADDEMMNVEKIVECYRKFELGKGYYHSPFWRFSKKLFLELNPSSDITGLLWTNLSKIDQNQTTPGQNAEEKNFEGYKLLEKEIEITKPNIVVFLTSWKMDYLINKVFPGAEFHKVSAPDSIYLARICHPALPSKTYRTYHPRFLNSYSSRYRIDDIIGYILKDTVPD
jgi:hypothetical protein